MGTILHVYAVLVILGALYALVASRLNDNVLPGMFVILISTALLTLAVALFSAAWFGWVTIWVTGWLLFGAFPLVVAMILNRQGSRRESGGLIFASAVLTVVAAFGLTFTVALHGFFAKSLGWHWTIGGGVWVIILAVVVLAFAALICFRTGNGILGALMVAMIILLVVVGIALPTPSGDTTATPKPSPSASASPSATPSATPSASCLDPLKYDPNYNGRVISVGLHGTAMQAWAQVQQGIHSDPRSLENEVNYFYPQEKITSYKQLTNSDGTCLNQRGHDLFYELKGIYAASTTKVVAAVAPASGFNTFVAPNGDVYHITGVITGNRAAIQVTITMPNGKTVTVWYMYRCGNRVTTTPTTPVPPPHTTCYSPGNGVTQPSGPPGGPPCAGKDPSQDVLKNPSVPAPVKGCSADGCGGGTATGPGHTVSPSPPGQGTTNCGASGNDPCPSTSPVPSPSSDASIPPPSTGPTAPAPQPTLTPGS